MTIDDLREVLKKDVATVTFTKIDGSTRVMHCTLIEDYLPPIKEFPNIKTGPSPFIATVWDLEQNAWRSFKFESVKSVETDEFKYVI